MTTKHWTAVGVIISAMGLVLGCYEYFNVDTPAQEINNASNSGINTGLIAGKIEVKEEVSVPKPIITTSQLVVNDQVERGYESVFLLFVDAKVPINNLYVQANVPEVFVMDISATHEGVTRGGVQMTGASGTTTEFAFTNIPNASGEYKIWLLTKTPQKATFDFSYDWVDHKNYESITRNK